MGSQGSASPWTLGDPSGVGPALSLAAGPSRRGRVPTGRQFNPWHGLNSAGPACAALPQTAIQHMACVEFSRANRRRAPRDGNSTNEWVEFSQANRGRFPAKKSKSP
jgi:hypothetical protein